MGSIHIKEKRYSVGQQPPPPSRSSSEELDFRGETATRAFAETTPAMPLHSQPTAPPARPADLVIIEEPKPKKIRLFGQTRRALSPVDRIQNSFSARCKIGMGTLSNSLSGSK